MVGGKLQNGKDVFITNYVSRLQFLFNMDASVRPRVTSNSLTLQLASKEHM